MVGGRRASMQEEGKNTARDLMKNSRKEREDARTDARIPRDSTSVCAIPLSLSPSSSSASQVIPAIPCLIPWNLYKKDSSFLSLLQLWLEHIQRYTLHTEHRNTNQNKISSGFAALPFLISFHQTIIRTHWLPSLSQLIVNIVILLSLLPGPEIYNIIYETKVETEPWTCHPLLSLPNYNF